MSSDNVRLMAASDQQSMEDLDQASKVLHLREGVTNHYKSVNQEYGNYPVLQGYVKLPGKKAKP